MTRPEVSRELDTNKSLKAQAFAGLCLLVLASAGLFDIVFDARTGAGMSFMVPVPLFWSIWIPVAWVAFAAPPWRSVAAWTGFVLSLTAIQGLAMRTGLPLVPMMFLYLAASAGVVGLWLEINGTRRLITVALSAAAAGIAVALYGHEGTAISLWMSLGAAPSLTVLAWLAERRQFELASIILAAGVTLSVAALFAL